MGTRLEIAAVRRFENESEMYILTHHANGQPNDQIGRTNRITTRDGLRRPESRPLACAGFVSLSYLKGSVREPS